MKDIGITVYGCERDEAEAFRSLAPRFGVLPSLIGAAVSESSALSARGNRCVSVSHKSEVSAPILYALKDAGVRYISTRSVGCDHIDLDAARRAGVAVGNAAYAPDSVADYTVMLMLMAARGAKALVRSVEEHDFRPGNVRGRALRDMTVGVVGVGAIGGAVIERLQGFGCRVLAYDRKQKNAPPVIARSEATRQSIERSAAVDRRLRRFDSLTMTKRMFPHSLPSSFCLRYVPLDELLQESDIVTLHVPLNAGARHIIGRGQLSRMKRGAFLVNTGRGALVDTDALIGALESGKLGGAALDVLEGEEGIFYFDWTQRPIDNPFLLKLQKMPNVILTPHTAYYTEQALRDIALKTIENCLDFERSLHGE
jgi:D-specific alpha-keto acid dehydrogenase